MAGKLAAPLIANLIGYSQCEDRVKKKGGKEDSHRLQKKFVCIKIRKNGPIELTKLKKLFMDPPQD